MSPLWSYRAACLHVVDGDTIRVLIDQGFGGRQQEDLRLANVHAPEMPHPGGPQTRDYVTEWMATLPAGAKWPLLVQTQPTTGPDPHQRRTFTRYVADVTDATGTRNLNGDIREFLAQYPGWGPGE